MTKDGLWELYCKETQAFKIQETVDKLLAGVPSPKILEAGCGSASHLNFKPNSRISGIDISLEQLNRNNVLAERILGDIQTYDLSGGNYDLIVCRFVLEHLSKPEKALSNFVRGLSPNGAIVIVAPNLFSIEGLAAKFTPHWFHVFARHLLFGDKRTGNTDEGPFPTPFRLSITPGRVKSFLENNGLRTQYFHIYNGYTIWLLCRRNTFMKVIFKIAQLLIKVLTLGKCDALLGTYVIVVSKAETIPESRELNSTHLPVAAGQK